MYYTDLEDEEIRNRITKYYAPYHQALEKLDFIDSLLIFIYRLYMLFYFNSKQLCFRIFQYEILNLQISLVILLCYLLYKYCLC